MTAQKVERQQVAVERRTFVVTTRAAPELPDGKAIAAEIRAAAMEAIRELPAPDARALGDALIAKAQPGPRPSAAIRAAMDARMAKLSGVAFAAVDAGDVVLEITAKPAVPRTGGRTKTQVTALVHIAAHGLIFHADGGFAGIPGVGQVKVSTARALARLGDIEPDPDEPDSDGVMWRITESGTAAMAAALNDLAM